MFIKSSLFLIFFKVLGILIFENLTNHFFIFEQFNISEIDNFEFYQRIFSI